MSSGDISNAESMTSSCFAAAAEPITRMRLSSPAEILAAVPYLLGFTPEASLVIICLREKQVGLTMRVDLDAALEMRDAFVDRLIADGADSAVVILFDPELEPNRPRAGTSQMRSLTKALEAVGIHIKDALGVRHGRYWSYLCHNTQCCPRKGRAVPIAGTAAHSKVAAPFVATGSAPLANRPALEASIDTVSGPRRTALDAVYRTALDAPAAHPVERWLEAVRRYDVEASLRRRPLSTLEAVRLIVGLQDVLVRDEVLSWTAGAALSAVLAVLREVAPLAIAPFDTQTLASLAWAAFAFGDGALAAVALERALAADPQHALAGLLAAALDSGVTPAHLHTISLALGGLAS